MESVASKVSTPPTEQLCVRSLHLPHPNALLIAFEKSEIRTSATRVVQNLLLTLWLLTTSNVADHAQHPRPTVMLVITTEGCNVYGDQQDVDPDFSPQLTRHLRMQSEAGCCCWSCD